MAVDVILEFGAHGELNRQIKQEVADHYKVTRFTSTGKVVEQVPRPRRMLGGQHDRDDFVKGARGGPERAVVLDVARRIAAETYVFVRAPGVIQVRGAGRLLQARSGWDRQTGVDACWLR